MRHRPENDRAKKTSIGAVATVQRKPTPLGYTSDRSVPLMCSRLRPRAVRVLYFLLMCSALALLSSCAHQPTPEAFKPPGFWFGLLHGFLIVFSFVGSLFMDVRIYAFPNSGVWYDFGYVLGACLFLGGGGASSK